MSSSETSTPSTRRKKINRTDLAYAAGIMDGEGCICAMWNSASQGTPYFKRYPTLRIDVTNSHKPLLVWFVERFGGAIYHKHLSLGTKPMWTWRVAAADMKWFLKLMIPFLKVKARQARLALILRHMIEVGSSQEKRIKILKEMQKLNSGKDTVQPR